MQKPFQEILDSVVKKELEALTPGDIQFLKARISYLTEEQLERDESVLKPKQKTISKK